MQAVDEAVFGAFIDALNEELSNVGATLRVDGGWRGDDRITLLDASGRTLGQLPDHADAAIIRAIEEILNGRQKAQGPDFAHH